MPPPCNDAVELDVDVVDVVDGVLEDGNCFEVEEETRNTGYDTDKVVNVGSVVEAAELSRDVCDVIDVVLVTGDENSVAADDGDDNDDVAVVSDDFEVRVVDRSDDVDIVELREVLDDVGEVSDNDVVGLEVDTEDDVDAVDREEVTELVEMAVK